MAKPVAGFPPVRDWLNATVVCCPVCGSDDVQLGPIVTSAGTTTTKGSDDGQLEVTSWPRRSHDAGVQLRMACGNGCEWVLALTQHREATRVTWEPLRETKPGTLGADTRLRD